MRVLFDAAQDSRPEDLQMAADLLRRLKKTNPDG
ncbi:MAG TPA: XRE family transcriptional regulator, partial [Lachnospiraceae bacterium]|nr:XRE family transcriptional regulator [Lachnospiraceae bacterium]